MKTVVMLFDNDDDAQCIVKVLNTSGFSKQTVGVLTSEQVLQDTCADQRHLIRMDVGVGIIGGVTIGGLIGALLGLGLLVIPDITSVLMIGTWAATVSAALAGAAMGATTGSVIGALVGIRIPSEDVRFFVGGVRRSRILVRLQLADDRVTEMLDVLRKVEKDYLCEQSGLASPIPVVQPGTGKG